MTPYELLEVTNAEYSDEDTIVILNDLIGELENNPRKYITRLSEEIENFAQEKELCILCGKPVKVTTHEESRGEYLGFNCTEVICEIECSDPYCPYTER